MSVFDEIVVVKAVQFAARWGFLEKEIFFKHICIKQKTQQYVYWRYLLKQGYFERSKVNDDVLYLKWNKKVKEIINIKTGSRFYLYVDHDVLVANLVLALQRNDGVTSVHLENELKEDILKSYELLGCDQVGRYPDALVIKDESKKTIAIEVEKTLKTYLRFNKMLLSYSFYEKVDSILFGVSSEAIGKAIKSVFWNPQHDIRQDVGIYLTDDFKQMGLQTKIETKEGVVSFDHFLNKSERNPFRSDEQRGLLIY